MGIHEIKQREVTDTPVVLFDCEVAPNRTERWSTHPVTFEGNEYAARVLRHGAFEFRAWPDEGIDAPARISVVLANADSRFSQIERECGFKGARTTVRFVFFDLKRGEATSEAAVLFRGAADSPEEITETTFRLNVVSGLNLQRTLLPDIRIQRRCPWRFPGTAEQRAEAAGGAAEKNYSPFWRCGYSPSEEGGAGTLDGGAPFTSCTGTRSECEARGMFRDDASGRETRRFGGIEYVPPTIAVRSHGERGSHLANTVENEARYNDFVPLVYGTAWYAPPIVFARNDGNLTRMEVLLGAGEIQSVLKVVVNGIEIPEGREGKDMTGTGWHKVITYGGRSGAFNTDFTDGHGNALGDPYGSMAMMSVVVPNRVSEGKTLPEVEVLVQGLRLPQFDAGGTLVREAYTNNPAWVLLDVLRRSGHRLGDLNLASFARAAAWCEERIAAEDLNGNTIEIPRFECNLVLKKRKSAAEVIRGIRTASRQYLVYGADGRLELRTEGSIAQQQPSKPEGSNSTEPLGGGWPAYEFGDGTNGSSGILRRPNGGPAFRAWRRGTAETPNRFTLEFQDAFNEYQQDSVCVRDEDDLLRAGQEITATSPALGVANWHQAARVVKLALDRSVRGNLYVEFETSVRAIGLAPGDIIAITYLREGLERTPFRIVKIEPGVNYRTALITAQVHEDDWYGDAIVGGNPGGAQGRRRTGTPRPLCGIAEDENGDEQFGMEEAALDGDGQTVTLRASFAVPRRPGAIGAPVLSFSPEVDVEGGQLAGGRTFYYGLTATGADGVEGTLSFVVRATTPTVTDTNRVTLTGLTFPRGAAGFNVYRGEWPDRLRRIAANQPLAASFIDGGLARELLAPPDENYDHANFYWRVELQPETQALLASADAIGNPELCMKADQWKGMRARITRGKGAGQERTIRGNSTSTLSVEPAWAITPDATSRFVVAQPGWRRASESTGSPAEFEIANRTGETVHVSGRAASATGVEAGADVSPITRWRIGGKQAETAPPPKPVFGLSAKGRGLVEISGIGFETVENTRTVRAGTVILRGWDELASPSPFALAQALSEGDRAIAVSGNAGWGPGDYVQVDAEVVRIEEALPGAGEFRVERAALGSNATAHAFGTVLYPLKDMRLTMSFPRDFFGSAASATYSLTAVLPDMRIAAAEMTVENAKGRSEPAILCCTGTVEGGLRSGSGGQFTMYAGGLVAIQEDAAAAIEVHEEHAIRNVLALLREAPSGGCVRVRLRQDEDTIAELTIPPGSKESEAVSGFGLAPLRKQARLRMDVLEAPQGPASYPGRDLTLMIRL